MTEITVNISFRPHQLKAWEEQTRFVVKVWHRRAGKTFYVITAMLVRALQTNRKDYRAYYVAPTFKAAKGISWDMLKAFTAGIPGRVVNEAELRVDFSNGARIQLLGAEQYDMLRGRYADDLTLDETALIPASAWTTVFSPMLADRNGRATFIGTPMGMMNLFYEVWDYAGGDDPEWSRSMLTYRDTNIIDPNEIRRLKRTMRPEEFAQEMECSWQAAIRGAFYAGEMAKAEAEGRVTTVKYDKMLPVVAAVDLGWSDSMAVGFFQQAGTEHRCLMALAYEGTSIPDMVADWRGFDFPVSEVILPHDAKVHELGSGKTRQEVFHEMGCSTIIAPSQKIHEGIAQVRDLLPHMWFDREETKVFREALNAYRSEYDEVRNVHRVTPLHDWSSHWADMMRYYALGRPVNMNSMQAPRPAFGGVV